MECDPQFIITMKKQDNEIFYVHTETLRYSDNFNFADLNKPNFTNPFYVKLPSLEV